MRSGPADAVSDDRPYCKCGCGNQLTERQLQRYPGQQFFSRTCTMLWNRQQPGFNRRRQQAQKRQAALARLDRWAQPAYQTVRDTCERKNDPLTRTQMAVIMVVLADVIAQAYQRGRNAERMAQKLRRAAR